MKDPIEQDEGARRDLEDHEEHLRYELLRVILDLLKVGNLTDAERFSLGTVVALFHKSLPCTCEDPDIPF